MAQIELAISLNDGQTIHAELRPEDERQLAELLGDRSAIQFASSADDVEGHAISGDVLVDVEGHAMVVRLPDSADAAALRRALVVGAVTATLVGAGVVAGLRPQPPISTTVEQAQSVQVQAVPGPALRAQRDEMQREAAQVIAVPVQQLQAVPVDANNPAIPAKALQAEGAESNQAVPLDVDNPAIPPQALRAGQDK